MQTMLTVVTQNSRLRRSALSGDRMAFALTPLSIAAYTEGHIAAQLAAQFTPALLALWVTARTTAAMAIRPIPIPRPPRPIPELATAVGRTTAATAILQLWLRLSVLWGMSAIALHAGW